jgi:hypothetical protein
VHTDSERLRRLAATTRLQADRVRLLALRVRAVGAVQWRSPAADLYRAEVEARARRLEAQSRAGHRLAHCIDDLAEAVERQGSRLMRGD